MEVVRARRGSEETAERKREDRSLPQDSASPRALPTRPRTAAPHASRATGPGSSESKHCRTNAALPSPGVRAAGATPAANRHGASRSADKHRAACRARGRNRRKASGAGCSAAGPGPHVPRRRRVRRRSTRRKLEESRGKFPRPALGGRELRQLLRRGTTTPSGPAGTFTSCRALRESPRESDRAREPPTSLPHSLRRGKRRSASPKPSITPIGPTQRTRSASHTRAGGDGQDATAISARGEGRSSAAAPPRALRGPETPPPASRLLSPPPFPPGLMDESRALLEPAFPLGLRREGGKEHHERAGCYAPEVGRRVVSQSWGR